MNCQQIQTAHKNDQALNLYYLPQTRPYHIIQFVSDSLTQLVLKNYLQTKFGKEWRNFHSEWFKLYSWLEYSILENSRYCFLCRFFLTDPSGWLFPNQDLEFGKKYGNK